MNIKSRTDRDDVSMRARSFLKMINKFQHTVRLSFHPRGFLNNPSSVQLPDMNFAINARAEGRVLVPWENRNYPNITRQQPPGISSGFFSLQSCLIHRFQATFPFPTGGEEVVCGRLIVVFALQTPQPDGS